MVYEPLSEVESDSDEQAQEEPASEELQKDASRADPLNAHYGEPESVARSGWVMRQSQGSPNRCTSSLLKEELKSLTRACPSFIAESDS